MQMIDYYDKVQAMNEEQLMTELDSLDKKLFKLNPGSAMYDQLLTMRETVDFAIREQMMKRRVKTEDTVLDIGTIESTIDEPEYNKSDIVSILVHNYTKGNK
jgi:hypothetical protein